MGGGKLLVRGHACSGKTWVLEAVVAECEKLGCPCVRIDRNTETSVAQALLEKLEHAAESTGIGVLVVDDLHSLVQTDTGLLLHTRIGATFSSPTLARAIGLLLMANCGAQLSPILGTGSSLQDLVQEELFLPTPSRTELLDWYRALPSHPELTTGIESLVEEYGACATLAIEHASSSRMDSIRIDNYLAQVASTMIGEEGTRLAAIATRQVAGKAIGTSATDSCMAPILYLDDHGPRIPEALVRRHATQIVLGASETWPSALDLSARRFSSRLYGTPEALWVDRYLGTRMQDLITFLDRVAQAHPNITLKLLTGSQTPADIAPAALKKLQSRLAFWRTQHLNIEFRALRNRDDDQSVHDRHLVFPRRRGGFSLPPADRVTACHPVGNEVDAYLPLIQTKKIVALWNGAIIIA